MLLINRLAHSINKGINYQDTEWLHELIAENVTKRRKRYEEKSMNYN